MPDVLALTGFLPERDFSVKILLMELCRQFVESCSGMNYIRFVRTEFGRRERIL